MFFNPLIIWNKFFFEENAYESIITLKSTDVKSSSDKSIDILFQFIYFLSIDIII